MKRKKKKKETAERGYQIVEEMKVFESKLN